MSRSFVRREAANRSLVPPTSALTGVAPMTGWCTSDLSRADRQGLRHPWDRPRPAGSGDRPRPRGRLRRAHQGATRPRRPGHAPVGRGARGRLLRGDDGAGGGRRRRRPRVDRPRLLRRRPLRRTRRHVHGLAQPRAVQRRQAVPGRCPPGRRRHRPGRRAAGGGGGAERPPSRAGVDARPPHHRRPAGRVRRPRRVLHRPHRRRSAPGRGRHRQRDGRPGRAQGLRAPPSGRAGGHVRRARRDLPQPPRRPDPARQPARPAGSRGRRRVRPRPRLRRRRRPRLRGRRGRPRPLGLDHHGDARRRDAGQAPWRHHPPQPHLLPRRPRGRPRARRHPRPDQGRPQLHQADHGRERRRVRR